MKFAIITDIHFGPAKYDTPEHRATEKMMPTVVARVVDQINEEPGIDFIVNLGDLVQERTSNPSREEDLKSAAHCLEILGKLNSKLYHVVSNHDRVTLSIDDLKGIFEGELYYSFETDEYKFITLFLESPAHFDVHLVDGETEWLKKELESSTKPVMIFMHQMLVEHPLEGTSCEGIPGCAYVRNKEEVKEIINSCGKVKAVFNGHLHYNLFKVEDGIPYSTVQAMTQPLPGSTQTAEAYAIVEVSNGELRVDIRGFDTARFSCKIPE